MTAALSDSLPAVKGQVVETSEVRTSQGETRPDPTPARKTMEEHELTVPARSRKSGGDLLQATMGVPLVAFVQTVDKDGAPTSPIRRLPIVGISLANIPLVMDETGMIRQFNVSELIRSIEFDSGSGTIGDKQ